MRLVVFNLLKFILVFSTLSFAMPPLDGVSTGGGGGAIIGDANNPWFVQNTKMVTYCIKRNREHFHLDDDTINSRIQAAINYWKGEFANSLLAPVGSTRVEIATQDFIRVDCSTHPDITFQMGLFEPHQAWSCQTPKSYIGLTVRETYDRVNLKGTGFVYIAPDSGDLKPDAFGKELIDQPWSYNNGALLFRVLVHEMGHVFGLQHTTTPPFQYDAPPYVSGKGMMNASYVEWVLRKELAPKFASATELPNYFAFQNTHFWPAQNRCRDTGLNQVFTEFFGIPTGWACYSTKYDVQNNPSGELGLFAHGIDKNDPMAYFGTIRFTPKETITGESAVELYLPDEETVFPNLWNRIDGPRIKYEQRMGIFQSMDGKISREVAVTLPLNEVEPKISGVMHGHYYLDLESGI